MAFGGVCDEAVGVVGIALRAQDFPGEDEKWEVLDLLA